MKGIGFIRSLVGMLFRQSEREPLAVTSVPEERRARRFRRKHTGEKVLGRKRGRIIKKGHPLHWAHFGTFTPCRPVGVHFTTIRKG